MGGSIAILVSLVVSIGVGAVLADRVLPDIGSVLVVLVWLALGAVTGLLVARAMTLNNTTERVVVVLSLIVGGLVLGAILALLIPAWIGIIAGAIIAGVILGGAAASAVHGRDGALVTLGSLVGLILFGAFTAITFGPRVGAAIGVAVGYLAWMAFMGADIARTGIDIEALKNRFYPVQIHRNRQGDARVAAETDAARLRVLAARAALGDELEVLEASARVAVDVPAKIRRSPGKTAAVVGGAAFVVVGRTPTRLPQGEASRHRATRAAARVDAPRPGRASAAGTRRRRGGRPRRARA